MTRRPAVVHMPPPPMEARFAHLLRRLELTVRDIDKQIAANSANRPLVDALLDVRNDLTHARTEAEQ